MRGKTRAVFASIGMLGVTFGLASAVGAASSPTPNGFFACLSANTTALVFPGLSGPGYQTQVTLTDYSDPNNPQDKPSSAVKVNTASSKTGVTITWTITDPPVHQLGGAVQTANATGYAGKWVNAKQVSATASTKGGNHLDFAVICFNDSRYPAPPSGSFGPGGQPSVAPAFRRH
jgi:hypothetical protein